MLIDLQLLRIHGNRVKCVFMSTVLLKKNGGNVTSTTTLMLLLIVNKDLEPSLWATLYKMEILYVAGHQAHTFTFRGNWKSLIIWRWVETRDSVGNLKLKGTFGLTSCKCFSAFLLRKYAILIWYIFYCCREVNEKLLNEDLNQMCF